MSGRFSVEHTYTLTVTLTTSKPLTEEEIKHLTVAVFGDELLEFDADFEIEGPVISSSYLEELKLREP